MHISSFTEEMERLAPPGIAEEFDLRKIGLVIEGRPEINTICCALDATPFVVREAVHAGADMLVVHHTPLWTPLTALTGRTAGLMRTVLAADMNLYVMHTNFDRAEGGVNDILSGILSLKNITHMSLGNVGTCTLSLEEISRRLSCRLRIWGELKTCNRLAVVAGSGFDPIVLEEAKTLGADAFLSAELKHSVMRASPLLCIEATHYALEAPAMEQLAAKRNWQYIADPPELAYIP